MKNKNKFAYLWILQGNYGYGDGWEDLCAAESYLEIRQNLKEYNENEGGSYRLVERRVKNEE